MIARRSSSLFATFHKSLVGPLSPPKRMDGLPSEIRARRLDRVVNTDRYDLVLADPLVG
jgi:hypothetical protein